MKLALLLCDTPVPAVLEREGTYLDIFTTWLESCNPGAELDIDAFDAVNLQLPSDIAPYDAVMLTGSKFDAHDTTLPFVLPLYDFVRRAAATDVKIVGVCFGHQIIANALGGKSGRGDGWEVGTYETEATEEGRKIWGDRVNVQQMHRDHVFNTPPDFHILLKSKQYENHSMVRYYRDTEKPQIITIQGHPEFTPAIVSSIIDARAASGVLNEEQVAEARRRVPGGEGKRLGDVIWKIMLA